MYSSINFAQGATFGMYLYCLLLYCFLLLISLRGNVGNLYIQENNKPRTILLFCGILLFSLTSFVGGDFFHYYPLMSEYRGQVFGEQDKSLEVCYQYLIHFIDGNYFLFRLIVWGCSLLLIVLATRQFGVNIYNTLFIISVGFIVTFSYARATLAMAVFTLGVIVICIANEKNSNKRVIQTIVGLLILASSIYFHRSMLPVVAIAVCWSLMPWKKQFTKHSLWLFPIFVAICSIILKTAFKELFEVANSIEDETGTLDRVEVYAEQEGIVHNINGYIRLALHYTAFYLPLFILSNTFRSENVFQIANKRSIWLYQIIFLIFVFATSFIFLDFDSGVFFYRYLYMSFIPISILIVYMKNSGILTIKQYHWIVTCFILSNLFQLFALVYSKR